MSDLPQSQRRNVPDAGEAARDVRRLQNYEQLSREAFAERFRAMYHDPAFEADPAAFARMEAIAWDGYDQYRKAPRTEKAGLEFADPDYDLSSEWRAMRDALLEIGRRQRESTTPRRILLICASPRSEHTCPGESSKTWRLLEAAREAVVAEGFEHDVLELNQLTSEYGKRIFPCKACVSTAMPLCHWPCSCYPNHAMAQAPDWMGDIYKLWMAAHGVVIVTPVHWNQMPSVLKLMVDRMVCADGGNPDPTRTQGKQPELAKQLELDGWDYPKHLAGRAYGLVVHGDAEGTKGVRHALADWLGSMGLVDAGAASQVDRYIGYYEPYATSHRALDRDEAMLEEARNVARAVATRVRQLQHGQDEADAGLDSPRMK
ncbi:FMN reductase [Lysobacter xinjiangensis]|uniref:FMN reductase n=1 Tax=Cognatilysobacter xinjiangensis TaxID=546892 RepID=A0ABQ3C790_9GAMM|nr:flavodoxin family protein [Lysobacter xinjiangensis]GGZ71789.1 FMN reductase [Lysobacter xinjiangensis]